MTTQSDINITPLIDVLLVLVIIFMLLSQRMVTRVQIPQEGGSGNGNAIVLQLLNDGSYAINTQPVAKAQLVARLREVFAPRQERILFVKAEGQRTYGETIEAVDLAKSAGIEVVALAP